MTDVRCPHCGKVNRGVATTAPEPRLCRRCGKAVMPPAQPPSALLARERLLAESSLARLQQGKAAAVDIDIDGLETVDLPRLLSRMRKAATVDIDIDSLETADLTPPERHPGEKARPLPTPAPLPRPRAAPFPVEARAPRPRRRHRRSSLLAGLSWLIGSLGLMGLAGAQAVGQRPQLLDLHPALRLLAERGCAGVGCILPARRDPGAFAIVASRLEPVAGMPGVSELRVRLRNGAPFAQALPHLRLTLLDDAQRPVARYTLAAADYRVEASPDLPAGAEVEGRALLEISEPDVRGFQVALVAAPGDAVRGADPTGVSHRP